MHPIVLILLAVLAAGFARPALAQEAVTLQLKWRHQFQFAGYYAALEKGYFREAGLDVRIGEGGSTIDPSKEVEQGDADFAVGSAGVLLDRQAGRDFVVLAVIFQHSPAVMITLRRSGLRTIADLAGKRLMDAPGSEEIAAMLKKHGVDYYALPRVEHSGDPRELMAGKADMAVAYSTNEPFYFEQAAEPYNLFTPRSVGIDLYGDNLFTTARLVRAKPDLVRAFRAASLRGWRYALENKAEIVDLIINKYGTYKSREALLFEAEQTALLIQADLVDLGYQSEARWQHIAEVFASQGMLPAKADIRGVLYHPEAGTLDRRLIWAVAALVVVTLVLGLAATTFVRLSRRLRQQVAEAQRAQAVLARSEAVKSHVAALASELQSADSLESVVRRFLSFTAPLVGAEVGAVFVLPPGEEALRFAGGYAIVLPKDWACAVGQGLVGQCARAKAPIRIKSPPDAELVIRMDLGDLRPAEVLLLPVSYSDALLGVVELGTLRDIADDALELLEELLPVLATSLHVLRRTLETERQLRQARERQGELTRAESRCRSVLEGLADGVLVIDETATLVLANPRIERMLGYGVGELVGRPAEAVLPGALTTGREHRQAVRKDGTMMTVDVNLSNGDARCLYASIREEVATEVPGQNLDGGVR